MPINLRPISKITILNMMFQQKIPRSVRGVTQPQIDIEVSLQKMASFSACTALHRLFWLSAPEIVLKCNLSLHTAQWDRLTSSLNESSSEYCVEPSQNHIYIEQIFHATFAWASESFLLTMDTGKVLTDLLRSFPPKGPLITRLTENELKLKAAITGNKGKVKVNPLSVRKAK